MATYAPLTAPAAAPAPAPKEHTNRAMRKYEKAADASEVSAAPLQGLPSVLLHDALLTLPAMQRLPPEIISMVTRYARSDLIVLMRSFFHFEMHDIERGTLHFLRPTLPKSVAQSGWKLLGCRDALWLVEGGTARAMLRYPLIDDDADPTVTVTANLRMRVPAVWQPVTVQPPTFRRRAAPDSSLVSSLTAIWSVGGSVTAPTRYTNALYRFDPVALAWECLPPVPTPPDAVYAAEAEAKAKAASDAKQQAFRNVRSAVIDYASLAATAAAALDKAEDSPAAVSPDAPASAAAASVARRKPPRAGTLPDAGLHANGFTMSHVCASEWFVAAIATVLDAARTRELGGCEYLLCYDVARRAWRPPMPVPPIDNSPFKMCYRRIALVPGPLETGAPLTSPPDTAHVVLLVDPPYNRRSLLPHCIRFDIPMTTTASASAAAAANAATAPAFTSTSLPTPRGAHVWPVLLPSLSGGCLVAASHVAAAELVSFPHLFAPPAASNDAADTAAADTKQAVEVVGTDPSSHLTAAVLAATSAAERARKLKKKAVAGTPEADGRRSRRAKPAASSSSSSAAAVLGGRAWCPVAGDLSGFSAHVALNAVLV